MGEYFDLWAGQKQLYSFRNHMPVEYYAFFQDSDRQLLNAESLKNQFPHLAEHHHLFEEERPVVFLQFDTHEKYQEFLATSPQLDTGTQVFIGKAEYLPDLESHEPSEQTFYLYTAQIAHIKKRMDLMGYSLDFVRSAFESHLEGYIQLLEEDLPEDELEPKLEETRAYTFDVWRDGLHRLILQHSDISRLETEHLQAACAHPLFEYFHDALGFPDYDPKPYVLRVMLECFDPGEQLVLDYTNPAMGGWENPDEPIVQHYIDRSRNETVPFSKVILLTEGTTDIFYLQSTLERLYPHLASRFSFLNFDGVKPDKTGTAGVISTVRAFASAGIDNTVVAILDNDAAGHEAMQSLSTLPLPDNIMVFVPPPVPHADTYPVLGPDGSGVSNVNGRATSIEFYLPAELLQDDQQKPIPVHWKSYMPKVGAYQGELSDKGKVMDNFKDLLKDLRAERRQLEDIDWTPTHVFWDALMNLLTATRTRINQNLLH